MMKKYLISAVYNGKRFKALEIARSLRQAKRNFFDKWGFNAYVFDIMEVKENEPII